MSTGREEKRNFYPIDNGVENLERAFGFLDNTGYVITGLRKNPLLVRYGGKDILVVQEIRGREGTLTKVLGVVEGTSNGLYELSGLGQGEKLDVSEILERIYFPDKPKLYFWDT